MSRRGWCKVQTTARKWGVRRVHLGIASAFRSRGHCSVAERHQTGYLPTQVSVFLLEIEANCLLDNIRKSLLILWVIIVLRSCKNVSIF